VAVIAPWNYPINLALSPLAASVAAGNATVIKPSELSAFTAGALADLLPKYVDRDAIRVLLGDGSTADALVRSNIDHVVFTGSPRIGSLVMQAAGESLTPGTLELGGKSPAIVDRSADLDVATRRIAFGKLMNAGQTCIAPDYVLVTPDHRDEVVDRLVHHLTEMTGGDARTCQDYGRIISDRHWTRLNDLIPAGHVVFGGNSDRDGRFLEPTVVVDPPLDHPIMQEEIFGPLLPIVTVDDLDAAISFVRARPKPLALYVFSEDDAATERVLARTSSGAASVNQTMFHAAMPELPFGGVGPSGMGRYRGLSGINSLSNHKSVLLKPMRPDLSIAYPPYGRLAKRFLRRVL
jgi:aldehyde dehydrogenase (NAD+)